MSGLESLAIGLAPEIGRWLFGSTGEQTQAAVLEAVEAVTGESDCTVALRVLSQDSSKTTELRLRLAKLAAQQDEGSRQAELRALKQQLGCGSAGVAPGGSFARLPQGMSWGGPAVSVVVLITFGVVLWTTLTHAMPAGSEGVLNVLLGMLGTGFAAVTNYWLGSSAGSQQKTTLLTMSQSSGGTSSRSSSA